MGVFYFHQPFNMSNVKTPESLSCFGELCFNRKAMKEYLDEQTFNAMIKVLDEKEQPSSEVIDSFAQGVLRWAAERGCTHITHSSNLSLVSSERSMILCSRSLPM